jgi:hypothetical protein
MRARLIEVVGPPERTLAVNVGLSIFTRFAAIVLIFEILAAIGIYMKAPTILNLVFRAGAPSKGRLGIRAVFKV